MTSHLARGQSKRLEMRERSQNILKSSDEISPLVSTMIEILGEFFLIFDEGRRCKVIYDENIFPHI
jgi:hypothetical protein